MANADGEETVEYYQATVTTTSEFADTLSVLLIEFGSEGVTVTDYEDIRKTLMEHNWDYADESLLSRRGADVYVSGYYPRTYDFSPLLQRLDELRGQKDVCTGSLEVSLTEIDSADYENEWKKYYTPIELDTVAIVPEWMRYDGDKLQVRIDPGMAFGTGSHETTRLCLRFLEHADVAGKACADIGCGSGILGATMLRLGAASCYMADIDEQATQAAMRNCELNCVIDRADIHTGTLPDDVCDKFSVVAANITADVLISLRASLCNSLRADGILVLSGIIHSRAEEVKAAYSDGFTLLQTATDGEWQGLLLRKKA